ncbi:MAG: hypothetical protein AAFU79_05375 [Myxococcota bacterium]
MTAYPRPSLTFTGRILVLTMAAAGGYACTDPDVVSSTPLRAIISGSVLVDTRAAGGCGTSSVSGAAMLFLFSAEDPGPPLGTGAPVGFVLVPETELFPPGAVAGDLVRADYVFPEVEPGPYFVSGFLDVDGDFNPAVPDLSQPSGGDIAGGFVDDEGQLMRLDVGGPEALTQVTIRLGQPVLFDRPAFAVSTSSLAAPLAGAAELRLDAVSLEMPSCSGFEVAYRARDAEGRPVDADRDGLADLFPRVLLSRPADDGDGSVLIEGALNPLPFTDALAASPVTSTTSLPVLIPPVSARARNDGSLEVQSGAPPGVYTVTVLAPSGQTWSVPNNAQVVFPGLGPEQRQPLTLGASPRPPAGRIPGELEVPEVLADRTAWVLAFAAEDPAPPRGTGAPVGVAQLLPPGTSRSFELAGLPDGNYSVTAFVDADGDFSPFVALLAEPSASDHAAVAPAVTQVIAGGAASPVRLAISAAPIGFSRPFFEVVGAREIDVASLPARLRVRATEIPLLDRAAPRFAVARAAVDGDGFDPTDVWPRALLLRLADGFSEPTPDGIIVPAWVDPFPFLGRLPNPTTVLDANTLDVVVLPTAFRIGLGAPQPIGLPPDGRYQLALLSPTGQTWRVPNTLDEVTGRTGTARARPSQSQPLIIRGGMALPAGDFLGTVRLAVTPPGSDFSVAVAAYDVNDPPPPAGAGRPAAVTVLDASAFGATLAAAYRLTGVPPGRYELRAFLDANANLVPWEELLAQPDAGDFAGGAVDPMGNLRRYDVAAEPIDADILIGSSAPILTEPPAVRIQGSATFPAANGGTVTLVPLDEVTAVGAVRGQLHVRWADVDGNGTVDDRDQDGAPDLFPQVFAQRLNEDGTLDPVGWTLPGRVDPAQFQGLGFPAGDPTRLGVQVVAPSVRVAFPSAAFRPGDTSPSTPPAGRWRITVVGPNGQVWQLPNPLARSAGTPLADTQGTGLTLTP